MQSYAEAACEAGIDRRLHSLFLPQLERLGATIRPSGFGIIGKASIPEADGWFWGASPCEGCLVTVVRLMVLEDFALEERPEVGYGSISLMSKASAKQMAGIWPSKRSASPSSDGGAFMTTDEELFSFPYSPGTYGFSLEAATAHAGAGVHFLPDFFENPEQTLDLDGISYEGLFGEVRDCSMSRQLRLVMRSISPLQASGAAPAMHYYAKALEALAALASFATCSEGREFDASGVGLSDRARMLIEETLGDPLTLDELAEELYVSRTRLCSEFKRDFGMSIGAYARHARFEEAQRLLSDPSLRIADIARQLGFSHPSGFDAMFKSMAGVTPRQWRIRSAGL